MVIWAYVAFGLVLAIGLVTIFLRGDWQKARGLGRLILLGPVFYAAPLAAFGTEHFTVAKGVASLIPSWIPWHAFWAYFVGVCFIAAALSLVTGVQARLAAALLGVTFFLFVVLMDAPGWSRDPGNRFSAALMLRQLAFSGGALALAASLTAGRRERGTHILATIARYFIAIPVLFYGLEQFRHGNYVPCIPLDRLTPEWVPGHAIWTYLAAAVSLVAGALLLIGRKTRAAATWLGLTVLFIVLVVYAPMAVADRASLIGINYMADTLMFCGAVLLLAGAMPREVAGADVHERRLERQELVSPAPGCQGPNHPREARRGGQQRSGSPSERRKDRARAFHGDPKRGAMAVGKQGSARGCQAGHRGCEGGTADQDVLQEVARRIDERG
ncbi:MAG: DoxX family protein [Acidobacteriota bacterium]